ncbi:MAG: TlpA family protein disulfide reductase [Mucilaginibacter sp.]
MKNAIITLAVILLTTLSSTAQFKLSGRIQNFKGTDSIVLNIPFIYGYYHENDIKIPISQYGYFNYTATIKEQKFVNFQYKDAFITLLLRPGKALSITIDSVGKMINMKGTAAPENQALYDARLNEIPFFLKYDNRNNPYAKMRFEELKEKLVKPWFIVRDKKIARVNAFKLPSADKKLIVSEINYQAHVQLNSFAFGVVYKDKQLVNKIIAINYDGVDLSPVVYPAGPFYAYFADGYINYANNKIFAEYGPADERSKAPFFNVYHISLDSAMSLSKSYDNKYIYWLLAKQYFKKEIAEQYLAQNIWSECRDKDISHIKPLMNEFEANFPQSTYLNLLRAKVNQIELLNSESEKLKNIDIFSGYEKINSIYDVINVFKGKVIYLDVWGTWCGPCKEELLYGPALKQHFKDKDIVFVYLDMDENDRDADWKKFIKLNGITGVHLRKSRADIDKFWEELLPAGHDRFYPCYFIFDKTGKLVQADTKRPSEGSKLYAELEKYF